MPELSKPKMFRALLYLFNTDKFQAVEFNIDVDEFNHPALFEMDYEPFENFTGNDMTFTENQPHVVIAMFAPLVPYKNTDNAKVYNDGSDDTRVRSSVDAYQVGANVSVFAQYESLRRSVIHGYASGLSLEEVVCCELAASSGIQPKEFYASLAPQVGKRVFRFFVENGA